MLAALNRWFGPAPTEEAKAATGPGVFAMSTYPQLHSLSRHPAKLMAEAQLLFHYNPWVKRAEQTIFGRYVKAAWHLEDSAGNTVDAKTTGPAKVAYDLIVNPGELSRRALWSLTMRHQGLCGNAFWYLDQRQMGGGPPTQCLYINPARMTPVQTEAGKLLGWMMDAGDNPVSAAKNLRRPVPFTLDEIRHFKLDEPDWDHYGIGIAEAAHDQVQLEEIATKHVSAVLSSGGRIAGLVSPKPNVTIGEEQWAAMVRDWRNIASDPEAAKRLLVVKGPVDFTNTAANFSELEMGALLSLSRDNVFAAWGIPLSQGPGIVVASGLNSGEAQKYEEAALWQGPIDLRSGPFEEQVQAVLDMFELGLKLIVESPAFDDQAPLFLNAEKATKQPLTNNERRALLGFDPLEDGEIGGMIFIEKTMIPLSPEAPVAPAPFGGTPPVEEDEVSDSGLGEAAQAVKADLRAAWEAKLRQPLADFLQRQATAIANRVKNNHAHLVNKPSDVRTWWNERDWNRELAGILEPLAVELAGGVSRKVSAPLRSGKADGYIERVLSFIRGQVGTRIVGINQTTRDSVARLITKGIEAGLSPADLADTIRNATTFDAARAELISRTETMTVYNEAALFTYREFDVKQVEAIDGDTDAECAARNGNVYSVDEAMGISDHPNGTLDWVPVIAKAQVGKKDGDVTPEDLAAIEAAIASGFAKASASFGAPNASGPVTIHLPASLELPPAQVTVNVPEQPAPIVNVNVPKQEAPVVNVAAPTPAKASTQPQQVIVTSMPARAHHAIRDKKGQISGSMEIDAE